MLWTGVATAIVVFLGASAFFGAPYVPSRRRHVRELFDYHYKLKPTDVVVDLGSGDGLVVREVVKRGARAVGVEIHPLFYALGFVLTSRYRPLAEMKLANVWNYSLPDDTTVVYAFSVSRDIKKMYKRLEVESHRLGRPLTFICYGAHLPKVEAKSSPGAFNIYLIGK